MAGMVFLPIEDAREPVPGVGMDVHGKSKTLRGAGDAWSRMEANCKTRQHRKNPTYRYLQEKKREG
jgi:hypothetical protein